MSKSAPRNRLPADERRRAIVQAALRVFSGGSYAGEIDVRTAFAYSKNTVAAQLGNEVGFGSVAAMARARSAMANCSATRLMPG